jgi:hypothetical protein
MARALVHLLPSVMMQISFKPARLAWKLARLRQLREAAEFVEHSIAAHVVDLESEMRAAVHGLSPEDADDVYDHYGDEYRRVNEVYAQALRRSLFVTLCSTFEVDLDSVCDEFISSQQLALRPKDLAGKGIVRSQSFIKKVARMPFPDTSPEWAHITHYSTIRNVIVHRGADVADHDQAAKAVNALKSIRVEYGELNLDRDFLTDAIRVFESFWEVLYRELRSAGHKGGWSSTA